MVMNLVCVQTVPMSHTHQLMVLLPAHLLQSTASIIDPYGHSHQGIHVSLVEIMSWQ